MGREVRLRTLRVDEVAEDFSVSRRTVERWISRGEIESVRIGHTRRIPVSALEKKSGSFRQFPPVSDTTLE